MHFSLKQLGLTSLILVAGAATVAAQTNTTGSISGRVVDSGGAGLAGVTIRATSNQVTRVVTSEADGTFRIALLTAGNWKIMATASGFQAQSLPAVAVSVNSNSALTLRMAKVSGAIVEVVATQSSVDNTKISSGMNASMDALEAIPMTRDIASVAFFAPGVVIGQQAAWSNSATGLDTSISGGSAAENTWVIDGLDTTDMRYGGRGASLVPDFVDQVEVQTGGFKPEYSALGGVFNVVTKSGTNNFKGSAWFTFDPSGIAAKPKGNAYIGNQLPSPARYDLGFEVGGALIKDRLFYFMGFDGNYQDSAGFTNLSGLTSDHLKTDTFQYLAKLNYYLTQDQQITFALNYSPSTAKQPNAYPAAYGNAQYGGNNDTVYNNYSLTYDATLASNLTFHLMAGESFIRNTSEPVDTAPIVLDESYWEPGGAGYATTVPAGGRTTPFRTGGIGTFTQEHDTTEQYAMDLTWVLGHHSIKFGVSSLWSQYKSDTAYADPNGIAGEYFQLYRTTPYHTTAAPPANRLTVTELYVTPHGRVDAKYGAIYLQDSWSITNNLTAFYGGRFEKQAQYDEHGFEILKFSSMKDYVQPRFGFTWDPTSDGKTKIQGSYAMYYERMPQRLAIREFANEQYIKNYYYTTVYNQANPSASTTDFTKLLNTVNYSTAFNYPYIEDGIKLPRRTEYMLGADHTFPDGSTVGVHWKYRHLEHIIEDSVIYIGGQIANGPVDTSPWGYATLWNPQPGAVYWNAVSKDPATGLPNGNYNNADGSHAGTPVSGYPKAYNSYRSIDITYEKRWDNNYINANWVHSQLEGNYEGVVSSSNGQPDGNITASFDQPPYVGTGLLPLDVKDKISFYGNHAFKLAENTLNVGIRYSWQSGNPLSVFDDGTYNKYGYIAAQGKPTYTGDPNNDGMQDPGGYGNATVAGAKLGQFGRTPNVQNTDLHLDYNFAVGSVKIIPSVDVFNLFNQRMATVEQQAATDQNGNPNPIPWGTPLSYKTEKTYRFGIKARF